MRGEPGSSTRPLAKPSRYISRLAARWLTEPDGAGAAGVHRSVAGTVAFADVSGFTALSERLARRGRGGAEELTDLINAVVSRMLAVTRPLGGDLLKYGGDALLLLFSGVGHERRAAAAAAAMQKALREFRNVASESGRVRLEMSIGVESGTVEAFLAGLHHRELFVAGPTVSRVVRLQELAGPGQIVVGQLTAGALPEAWLGKPVAAEARLLRTRVRISASEAPDPAGPDADGEAQALLGVPRALQARLGGVDGEHRQVAVGFVQCGGLDDLLRDKGAEPLAQALNTLTEAALEACSDHEVTFLATDVGVSSVKLVLAAGAPTTTTDNEDRLLAVLRAVVDVPASLSVRAGVHRGRAFAVEVGDDQRRVYTVLGDTVNLAARMMAAAPEGGILATAAVFDRLRVSYSRQPADTFQVKGFSEPVEAALVGRLEPVHPVRRPVELPFVGRQEELAVLREAVESARTGNGRVIEVVGEPGIGKSRLLAEALAEVGDLPTVVIQARQYAKAEAYAAVRGPLRRLLGAEPGDDSNVTRLLSDRVSELVPEVEPLLPLIGVPFGLRLPDTEVTAALGADHRREELRTATIRLLLRMFPESGVLAIEDPYWLDEGSGHLLARLAGVLPGWAVFVAQRVSTPRLDLSGVSEVVQLELDQLPTQAAELLASSTGKLTAEETVALARRSNGNPLFLEELAAAVAGGAAIDELPDTVEAVIAAHLDTLDPPERDLARIASVLGSDFPTRLLFDLAEVDPENGRATLERLAGVLVAHDGSSRFAHALLRESAYEGLSYRRRRALHGKAGDLLRSGLPQAGGRERRAALLSLHYSLAKRHRDCWEWSLIAAERARHDAAPVEAVAFLGRALESAKAAGVEPAGIASVHEQLGDLAELAGLYANAADAYRRARRLRVYDPVAAAGLLRKQGHVAEREGRYQVALQLYARGFRALEKAANSETEERVRVELRMASGATRLRQGRYVDAIRELEEASKLAELHADLPSLAHAYYLLDWAHTDLGRPDPRYRALALPIYEELGDWLGQGNVLNNLGADAYYEGRWSDALEFYRRSRDACERVGANVMAAAAIHNIGETLCEQGYFDEARLELSNALETWKLAGYPGANMATANLGRLAARTGAFERAEDLLAGAMRELGRIGAESAVVDVEMREVERRVLMGHGASALELGLAVRGRAEQPVQQAFLDQMIGWARAQVGEYDAARAAFYASLRTAQQIGARYEEARTRSALARLASLRAGGVATDTEAEQILEGLGVIWTPLPPLPSSVPITGRDLPYGKLRT